LINLALTFTPTSNKSFYLIFSGVKRSESAVRSAVQPSTDLPRIKREVTDNDDEDAAENGVSSMSSTVRLRGSGAPRRGRGSQSGALGYASSKAMQQVQVTINSYSLVFGFWYIYYYCLVVSNHMW